MRKKRSKTLEKKAFRLRNKHLRVPLRRQALPLRHLRLSKGQAPAEHQQSQGLTRFREPFSEQNTSKSQRFRAKRSKKSQEKRGKTSNFIEFPTVSRPPGRPQPWRRAAPPLRRRPARSAGGPAACAPARSPCQTAPKRPKTVENRRKPSIFARFSTDFPSFWAARRLSALRRNQRRASSRSSGTPRPRRCMSPR